MDVYSPLLRLSKVCVRSNPAIQSFPTSYSDVWQCYIVLLNQTTIIPTLTKTSQPCDVLRASARHRAQDLYTKVIPKMSVRIMISS